LRIHSQNNDKKAVGREYTGAAFQRESLIAHGPAPDGEDDFAEGKMWAYEMKWSPNAKASLSKTFINAYPAHEYQVVHRDNFYEWLSE
jgi:hypothetical protein